MGSETSKVQATSPERHLTEGRAASKRTSVYGNHGLLFHTLSSCITKHSLKPLFSCWSLNMYSQAQNLKRNSVLLFVETFDGLLFIK